MATVYPPDFLLQYPYAIEFPYIFLAYQFVSFDTIMATDRGSGAKGDLSTWRPQLPPSWYYLGQAASADWTTSPKSIIVKELQPDVLKDVVDWELVWSSEGSGTTTAYAFWRGVPPSDEYAVVGGIFTNNPGWACPTKDQTSGIKAVRKDALRQFTGSTETRTLSTVWTNEGNGATRRGSVWTIVPHLDFAADVDYSLSMIPAGDDKDWKEPSADICYMISVETTVDVSAIVDAEGSFDLHRSLVVTSDNL